MSDWVTQEKVEEARRDRRQRDKDESDKRNRERSLLRGRDAMKRTKEVEEIVRPRLRDAALPWQNDDNNKLFLVTAHSVEVDEWAYDADFRTLVECNLDLLFGDTPFELKFMWGDVFAGKDGKSHRTLHVKTYRK